MPRRARLLPLGKYWRSMPLAFSSPPRCCQASAGRPEHANSGRNDQQGGHLGASVPGRRPAQCRGQTAERGGQGQARDLRRVRATQVDQERVPRGSFDEGRDRGPVARPVIRSHPSPGHRPGPRLSASARRSPIRRLVPGPLAGFGRRWLASRCGPRRRRPLRRQSGDRSRCRTEQSRTAPGRWSR